MSSPEITALLRSWADGDEAALDKLIVLLSGELRKLARIHFLGERVGHTLQPTAIVNEAYLRLVGNQTLNWKNRAHFLGACSRIMRRVLVDHARRRDAVKRGRDRTVVSLDSLGDDGPYIHETSLDLIALDNALAQLGILDTRQAKIVELHYFVGLTFKEIAAVLGFTDRTIKTEWKKARVWLAHHLS